MRTTRHGVQTSRAGGAGGSLVVCVLSLALLGANGPASARVVAEPQYQPVTTLAKGEGISRPDAVVDAAGRETVAWSRKGTVWAQRRTAAGVWRDKQAIGFGRDPQLGVDAAGHVTAVYAFKLAHHGPQVMVTTGGPGARAWDDPVPLTPAVANNVSTARGAFEPTLAVGSAGDVVVAWLWNKEDSGASRVQAVQRPAGGDWSAVATLSATEAHDPSAAVDGSGRAAVAWARNGDISVARRTAATWGSPELVGEHGQPPALVSADDGTLAVVFSGLTGGVFRPFAATRQVGGPWTAPQQLDSPAADVDTGDPRVGITSAGTATVAWGRSDRTVLVSSRAEGGSWSGPTTIAPAGEAVRLDGESLDVAVAPNGYTLVSFTRTGPDGPSVSAAFGLVSAWTPAQRLSGRGCSAARGTVRDTSAVSLVWRCTTGKDRVQYRHAPSP